MRDPDPFTVDEELLDENALLRQGEREPGLSDAIRQQVQEARRVSELKNRHLIEITRDLMYVTDRKGFLTYVNPTLGKALGYTYEEWNGQPYTKIVAPEYVEAARNIFRTAMDGESDHAYVTEIVRKDGKRITIAVNVKTLYDAEGNPAGRYGVGRDITGERQDAPPAPGPHTPDGAGEAEMSSLIVTYFGQSHDEHRPLDLAETCRLSLPAIQAGLPGNVVLQATLPAAGPVISANPNQIRQVLANLLANAVEAAGAEGGDIRLSVKTIPRDSIPVAHRFPITWQPQADNYARLELTDAGCGIEGQNIEKLFDPFYTTRFTGRGLGLTVVMGIVRAHGGVITVESEPGRGSTFRVFFPVVAG